MKKLFLVCLMMLAGSAWAEWVTIGDYGEVTFYFDPATIRKDRNMRRVWEIQDLNERIKSGAMSLRMRVEYDCKQERFRYLEISSHSEPMAFGRVLELDGEDENWGEIAPNTAVDRMLQIVCSK
jgi:hypothetical protein